MHPATIIFIAGVIGTFLVCGEWRAAFAVFGFVVFFVAWNQLVHLWRNRR